MEAVVHAILPGLATTLQFLWDSLFGLIFGFLISGIVQVCVTPRQMYRWLGGNLAGYFAGAGFGIVSSACSYGAATAARGFFMRGADIRSVFSFLISSTNMNVSIVILFWALLGWHFAFAEFFGGVIIIAVVVSGFSLLFAGKKLTIDVPEVESNIVRECPLCGMEGEEEHAVSVGGITYWACGLNHERALRDSRSRKLSDIATWRAIWRTMQGDFEMLRNDLIIGYVVAGYLAALVPPALLSSVLKSVGAVPAIGYILLLLLGLLIAVFTFVCSMGNVPLARFLALAGIPLGANTTFIYGDLLVLPLIGIYRKSFPNRFLWAFLALFVVGAMVAGAVMDALFGGHFTLGMGSMAANDRFTLISNICALLALGAVILTAGRPVPMKGE